MPPKKLAEIIRRLNNEKEYYEAISDQNPKIVVLDLHLDWCGPCKAVETNYRMLMLLLDDCETFVEFMSIGEKEMPLEVFQKLNLTARPRF